MELSEKTPLVEKHSVDSTKPHVKALTILFTTIIIATACLIYIFTNSTSRSYYVVLSSDLNLYYLVHVPFAIQAWKNLGVNTLLMMTLEPNETTGPAVDEILAFSKKLGAEIVTITNNSISTGRLAQSSRAFAAGTKFSHSLDPKSTIFITSDVDFFPSNLSHHIPDHTKDMLFYDFKCCTELKWKEVVFNMYGMITIAMTLSRWREIMDLPSKEFVDGSSIEHSILKTFDNSLNSHDVFWRWFLDQRLFSYKLHLWKTKNPEEFKKFSQTSRSGRRLDRKTWPEDNFLRNMSNVWDYYEAAHVTPGIFMDSVWEKNLVFYEKIFTSDQLEELTQYRNDVVKHINVTETLRRHYHPEENNRYWRKTFKLNGMLNDGRKASKHAKLTK
ncbi:unnamed protein product [Bursaphelenchus okinawaensis]|uniref:Nucleotide-diphospho-sugar transferase domain-containing protein n=1 Tax=Bursaphelenchus okinawaensis TaxID=465554 RepID=A0A811KLZ3_9BILA|nr:unnamed protein product [Bursaphelenchus okinawaensis]CAG9105710.1 unnamed protein product [Bursaphelenchus okinawaensis]